MRHRIGGVSGIGNSKPPILDNKGEITSKLPKEFCDDVVETFDTMRDYDGFDFMDSETGLMLGIEPAYQDEPLEIVYFDFYDKNNCFWRKGVAMGAYGSDVVFKTKYYGEYKRKAKFVKFIDKWYETVRGALCKDT